MKALLIGMILLYSSALKANTDKAAHFGVSYAMQTAMYGFSRKGLRLNKNDAFLFSATTVLFTGLVWEFASPNKIDGGDIMHNIYGVGASIGTCLVFDF